MFESYRSIRQAGLVAVGFVMGCGASREPEPKPPFQAPRLQQATALLAHPSSSGPNRLHQNPVTITVAEPQRIELVPELGHTSDVNSVAFSRDGRMLASGGKDMGVHVWDPQTGRLLRQLMGHQAPVIKVGFSDVGDLITVDQTGTILIWDVATFKLKRRHVLPALQVATADISLDGMHVALGDKAGFYRQLNTDTAAIEAELPLGSQVWAVGISPDGKQAMCSTGYGQMYYVDERRQLHPLKADPSNMRELESMHWLSKDRWLLASTGGNVRVWDVAKDTKLHDYKGDSYINPVAPINSSGDDWVSSLGEQVQVVHRGVVVASFKGHNHNVTTTAVSPDGQLIASGSFDKSVRLWNIETKLPSFALGVLNSARQNAVLSADGWLVAVGSGHYDYSVKKWVDAGVVLWDLHNGSPLTRFDAPERRPASAYAFSANGQFVAASHQYELMVFDTATKQSSSVTCSDCGENVRGLAFSGDGQTLFVLPETGAIRSFRLPGLTPARSVQICDTAHNAIATMPGRSLVAVGSSSACIGLWDPTANRPALESLTLDDAPEDFAPARQPTVPGVAFCAQASRLVTATGKCRERCRLTVFDLEKLNKVHSFSLPQLGEFSGVGCSTDGRYLVTGSEDGTVAVVDGNTGTLLATDKRARGAIRRIVVNGRDIVYSSADGGVRVFKLP